MALLQLTDCRNCVIQGAVRKLFLPAYRLKISMLVHGTASNCLPSRTLGFRTTNSTFPTLRSCLITWPLRLLCSTTACCKLGLSSSSTRSFMVQPSCSAWLPRQMAVGRNRYRCLLFPRTFFNNSPIFAMLERCGGVAFFYLFTLQSPASSRIFSHCFLTSWQAHPGQ